MKILMEQLRQHWDDGQVVKIMGVIALFGFLNRWADFQNDPRVLSLARYGVIGKQLMQIEAAWPPPARYSRFQNL